MLVLSRRAGQSIQIGPDITVTVISTDGQHVRLGIQAPRGITVLREELKQIADENQRAVAVGRSAAVEQLLGEVVGSGLLRSEAQANR